MVWAPDYLTVEELKSYVRIDDVTDDAELAMVATAASRAVDDCCNRQFGKVDAPEKRYYTARWNRRLCRWVVPIDDLQTTTGLVVEVGGVAVTDYTLEPRNAVAEGLAWTRLVLGPTAAAALVGPAYEVAGTAPWGWSAFPGAVKHGTKLQASRFASRRDSPFGVAGSPQDGSELRLLARVDPDVAVSLRRYRKPRGVG